MEYFGRFVVGAGSGRSMGSGIFALGILLQACYIDQSPYMAAITALSADGLERQGLCFGDSV